MTTNVDGEQGRTKGTIELVLGFPGERGRGGHHRAPLGQACGSFGRTQLAIHRAAGPGLAQEYQDCVGKLPGGRLNPFDHIVTAGHALRARYVVHCSLLEAREAGEHARGRPGQLPAEDVFETCRSLGVDSVALPALGTGACGYRTSMVARVSMRCAVAAQRHLAGPSRIRFLLAGPATLESFLHALSSTD
jgi:O-acetyl-ADP-ribose deacetylase (regulator of RNase III)